MQLSVALIDFCGTPLEARCRQLDQDPAYWRVQFWGPSGLRYSTPIQVGQGLSLEEVLQQYVNDYHLVAVASMTPLPRARLMPLL